MRMTRSFAWRKESRRGRDYRLADNCLVCEDDGAALGSSPLVGLGQERGRPRSGQDEAGRSHRGTSVLTQQAMPMRSIGATDTGLPEGKEEQVSESFEKITPPWATICSIN